LVLIPLFAFVFLYLPNLSAARHSGSKSAVGQKASTDKGKTKVVAKSTSKVQAKPATKDSASGSAKRHSTQSASSAKTYPKGSSKGYSQGALKRSPRGSQRTAPQSARKGSSRTASKSASKRSQPTVYRQQQPDSERIREIQQALTERGYPLEANGAWDASTVDALKKFQTEQKIENLSGKGKLDSMTLIALGLGPKRESPSGLPEAPKPTPEGK
jgi:hypothetical protein